MAKLVAGSKASAGVEVSIIGAGTLATALAMSLHRSGYRIGEIVSRDSPQSIRRARWLARRVRASAATLATAKFDAKLSWICVPDDSIQQVAEQLACRGTWRGKIVAHASGALGSGALNELGNIGAHVASAHPLMTFVGGSRPTFLNVPFALEGDSKALRTIARIVRALGAKPFCIEPTLKAAYHAFGYFSSPAFVELFAAAQRVGQLAGFSESRARKLMEPIVRQTVENVFRSTPQQAFSGPLRRGDVATIRKHLETLQRIPEAREAYRALARVAMRQLPVRRANALRKLFD
jgi:predicted short-subunit dehydrogenase-like oxidoreductase (DUF2520 family)